MTRYFKALWLFVRIIGREHWCGRCTFSDAWIIVKAVYLDARGMTRRAR